MLYARVADPGGLQAAIAHGQLWNYGNYGQNKTCSRVGRVCETLEVFLEPLYIKINMDWRRFLTNQALFILKQKINKESLL